jgi:hypothetical protein
VAAALLVVVAGLGWRVAELGRRVDRLSAPIVGLPYREVQLTPEVRGSWKLTVPEDATHLQLGIILVDQPVFPEYRIDLVHPGGGVFFQTDPLEPRREYSVTLPLRTLPVRELEEAGLWIRLYGLRDGEATLLKEETVTLTPRRAS